jgi:hypothetical protein
VNETSSPPLRPYGHPGRLQDLEYCRAAQPDPLLSAAEYRQVMADRFAVWTEITGATTTAAA